MMMLGKLLNAKEAEKIGLFNEVVPQEQLMPRALEVAQELAAGPPWAVRWTKYCLNQWLRTFALSAFYPAMAMEALTMFTQDSREAVRAFRERRPGRYEGK